MILEIFAIGPLANHTIFLGCSETKKAAIIDPACGSASKVFSFLEKYGMKLELILITHSHWDHIADAKKIKEKTGAKIYVHRLDKENLENPGADGLPLFVFFEGVKGDHFLEDREEIALGKIKIKTIHTPGHTQGSVCFFLEKQKILFSGDTLFRGSMGKISFANSEPEKMWSSLKKLSKLPKDTRVVPGHGDETTIGQEDWLDKAESIFS